METGTGANSSKEERVEKWMSLMNTDLQMKVRIEVVVVAASMNAIHLLSSQIICQDDLNSERRSCELGDALFVEFEGRIAKDRDDHDGPKFQDVKDWLVVVGDKDTTPALEMGLRFMQDGETSLIYSDAKYAYGLAGRHEREYVLPSNSNVVYRVHIKRHVPADSDLARSPSFQIEIARSRKAIGNDCFQFEWCDGLGKGRALMMYKKAADAMTNLITENDDDSIRKEASAILVDCLNNMAAVYLKAKEFGKAKDAATKVILRDPDNVKALLRAARAALYDPAGTFEECAAAIAAAEQVDPSNSDLRKLKSEHRRKTREYKEKSKAMFSKMGTVIGGGRQETARSPENFDEMQHMQNGDSLNAVAIGDVPGVGVGTIENNLVRKYLPYVLQIAIPWISYYIFTLMKRESTQDEQ